VIKGRHVNLRRMKIDDVPNVIKWRQDAELSRYYDELPINTPLEIEHEIRANLNSPKRLDFVIETKRGDTIGMVYLMNISWKNKNTELHIKVGESEKRRFIFGAEASFLLLLYSFNNLNMHKVYGRTLEYARESERLIRDVGFEKEAVFRKMIYQRGRFWDLNVYGILDTEFRAFLTNSKGRRYLEYSRQTFGAERSIHLPHAQTSRSYGI